MPETNLRLPVQCGIQKAARDLSRVPVHVADSCFLLPYEGSIDGAYGVMCLALMLRTKHRARRPLFDHGSRRVRETESVRPASIHVLSSDEYVSSLLDRHEVYPLSQSSHFSLCFTRFTTSVHAAPLRDFAHGAFSVTVCPQVYSWMNMLHMFAKAVGFDARSFTNSPRAWRLMATLTEYAAMSRKC